MLKPKLQKLGDLAKGTEMVSRGLEVILQIRRLGGNFAGLMVALHPPSLLALKSYILIGLDDSFIIFLTFNCIFLNIFWLFTLSIQELSYNIFRDLKKMPSQF